MSYKRRELEEQIRGLEEQLKSLNAKVNELETQLKSALDSSSSS